MYMAGRFCCVLLLLSPACLSWREENDEMDSRKLGSIGFDFCIGRVLVYAVVALDAFWHPRSKYHGGISGFFSSSLCYQHVQFCMFDCSVFSYARCKNSYCYKVLFKDTIFRMSNFANADILCGI